jgi:predicted nucleotidyltransferase
MNDSNYLNEIRKDLKQLKAFNVVIYGSYLSKHYIPDRSDIDIAMISQNHDKEQNITLLRETFGKFPDKYDIKVFELMPLFLKIDIISNYEVLFGNPLEISEYFYHYRSIWKDMKYRIKNNQFKSISEKIELIQNRDENI